ncbi:MAG: 30S ribosomal protein S9 [Candidatus Aminicenantes bacterium]|nr:MAG: 30S ribosomal protein S9 [Candidatus Aminicenantes bacterium]
MENYFYATGKRKSAIARIWMKEGEGSFIINNRSLEEYFPRETLRMIIKQPFYLTNTYGKYDVKVNVKGGGSSGQAGAIRHGISRALLKVNEEFRAILKKDGFLTRDARIKERKKYGRKKARKRFQYSKR